MDRGVWWAAVHGVAKSRTRLSNFTFTFHFHALEKEMATHSSVLAWRIPGMGEPDGLPSMGSQSRTWLKWLNWTALMIDSRDSVRKPRRVLEYPACFTVKTRMLVTKRQSPEIEQEKGWECIGFRKTAFGQSRRFSPVGGCLYGFGAQRRTTEIIGSSIYGLRCLRGCMHTCCTGWEPAGQKALGRGPIQPRFYTCGLSVSTC